MSYVQGIDVASYQPNNVDPKGLGFVFVKATQGTNYTNPKAVTQSKTARKGAVVGFYHFMQPGDSVTAQVAYFKSRDLVQPGDLIAVDWEGLNGSWASSADKDAMLRAFKAAYPKNRVGLYTNLDGWLHHDTSNYCADFLWIADITTPGKPRIQHGWTFHQYGQRNGEDSDLGNFQTQAALKAWAGLPVSPTPPTATVPSPEYRAVLLNDVFPTPEGHTDSGGTGQWTLQTFLSSLYEQVADNNRMLKAIMVEIDTSKGNPSA